MRLYVLVSAFAGAALVAREAGAQVHWDVGAQAGVTRRILMNGTGDGNFGPMAGLKSHVALLPLVRVGGYASYDLAPVSSGPVRHVVSGGLEVKGNAPWFRGDVHAWLFAGVGYAGVFSREAGGSHLDVPVGIGVGYRFRRPWELTLEIGSRFGFAFAGRMYAEPTDEAGSAPAFLGNDRLSPFAAIGVTLDL